MDGLNENSYIEVAKLIFFSQYLYQNCYNVAFYCKKIKHMDLVWPSHESTHTKDIFQSFTIRI